MNYSNGMGIEMPVWVIQTPSGRRTLNRKTGKFESTITEDSTFATPLDAADELTFLDFGYVIKPKRLYRDLENMRIY